MQQTIKIVLQQDLTSIAYQSQTMMCVNSAEYHRLRIGSAVSKKIIKSPNKIEAPFNESINTSISHHFSIKTFYQQHTILTIPIVSVINDQSLYVS
ncbi:hypothetical protein B5X24_HaOG207033 [Helicoverpa armigera]|uniref:Uncharacterized protein n=1 Tax=Helicoverpa armigera TaxID=29058 RepID=A0A2W1BJ87_HELAM|nr:hypothetical protein B5X24_HaOG207033 [Helicoverpa armigera]